MSRNIDLSNPQVPPNVSSNNSSASYNLSICPACKGTGLTLQSPVRCDCGSFCFKCQNNEGYLIHPQQSCDNCCGTGNLETARMVLCLPI